LKKRCLVLLIFVLLICVKGNCQDGVLISNRPHSESQAASDHIRQALEPFVQQVVTNKLIEEIQDVLKRSVEQLGVGLRPELALLASQRATLQSFKQESTLTLIRDSYHQAVKQYQQGLDQKLIEQSIINLADVRLRALLDDYVFQQIIKMVLEKALTTQQQIMMQAAMQQVVQQKINEVLQEQQEVAKEIQQQYQNSFLVR